MSDWADEEAAELVAIVRFGRTLGDDVRVAARIANRLRLVKQQGKCDGLAKAQDALKEAFKK